MFNIRPIAEMTVKQALENFSGRFKIGGRKVNNLRYAEDIVLIITMPTELLELINRIAKSGSRYGLVINKGKTKVMAAEGNSIAIISLQQGDHMLSHLPCICVVIIAIA